MGVEVGSLPQGYETVTIKGDLHYKLDDIYYMPSITNKSEDILIVVEKPSK